ncbi:hypothetical protein BHE74_00006050, partial [Ensete ventricosum]
PENYSFAAKLLDQSPGPITEVLLVHCLSMTSLGSDYISKQFAKNHGLIFMETSAKTAQNVEESHGIEVGSELATSRKRGRKGSSSKAGGSYS